MDGARAQIRSLGSVKWATALDCHLPPPPEELKVYAHNVSCAHDDEELCRVTEQMFVDVIVDPPQHLKRIISGGANCLKVRSWAVEQFFLKLFEGIRSSSLTPVELEPWDLSHGHMVCSGEGSTLEFAVVFHAKEFPAEYRHSTASPIYPIGHPSMGGGQDPRVGTKRSVHDSDFHLRNYVYVMSENQVYLLNPKAPGFDDELLLNKHNEFFTVAEGRFGEVVGDVNYLPNDSLGLIFCPKRGIRFEAHLQPRLRALEKKSFALSSVALESFDTNDRQLLAALRTVDSFDVQAVLADLRSFVRRSPLDDLRAYLRSPTVLARQDSDPLVKYIADLAARAVAEKVATHEAEREVQKEKLLGGGVEETHAEEFLEKTKSTYHGYSAFRAMQVLEVVHPQYRSPTNRLEFGDRLHSADHAVFACKRVVYADSALEALSIHKDEKIELADACARVVSRKEAITRKHIIESQRRQQLRLQEEERSDKYQATGMATSQVQLPSVNEPGFNADGCG